MLNGLVVGGRRVDGVNLTGSQVLRDINTTTQGYFASNSVGTLANYLNQTNYLTGVNGGLLRNGGLPENFIVANPQFASARLFGNLSNSTYHSLQLEFLQRMRSLMVQWNYTFARAIGDEEGDGQEQIDSFRTQRNRNLDKRLLNSSLQHVMRANAIWDLPFGTGRKWASNAPGFAQHLIGGWQIGVIFNAFSGDPLGFSTGAATFNQFTDNTPMVNGKLRPNVGKVVVDGTGVTFLQGVTQSVDPSIAAMASATVRARSTLRQVTFGNGSDQVTLFNPVAGQVGSLSQRAFYGPGYFRFDANIIKTVRITESVNFQFNAIFENASNTPQWNNPNLDINSLNFGRITGGFGNRIVVLGGRVNF